MDSTLQTVTLAVTDLELERIAPLLREALAEGRAAPDLLQAMNAGMVRVGELFQEGEYYLADLVLAGEVMKEGLAVIEPYFQVEGAGRQYTVVLCTVKGDIHDIGKNLVGRMLTSCGFRVVDLGVDVAPHRVVEAVRANGAQAVGLSVLLTPMVGSIAEVAAELRRAGMRDRVKIAIGGACTTTDLVDQLGVDAMGRDPVEAVEIFRSWEAADVRPS